MSDITYDYGAIETALQDMEDVVKKVQGQADEQRDDVKSLLGNWTGSTADSYNKLCGDLDRRLGAAIGTLDKLKAAYSQGTDDMKNKDQQGSDSVGSS